MNVFITVISNIFLYSTVKMDYKVMNNIQNLEKKITIIIVTHRLSTVRSCDKIFLLEKGELKVQGTYEYLINNNKTFIKMTSV